MSVQRILVVVVLLLLVLAACSSEPTVAPAETQPMAAPTEIQPTPAPSQAPTSTAEAQEPFESPLPTDDTFESPVTLPNPASKYCEDQGYTLELRTSEQGVTGYCVFPDDTECEEWAFYREECGPGTPQP